MTLPIVFRQNSRTRVFGQTGDFGPRNLGWFLKLSGPDVFVAYSDGAQQAVAAETSLSHQGPATNSPRPGVS